MAVKEKNGQIRCCVDFKNLNRVCPKDEFPLPNREVLIDSTAGNTMFSFMDRFSEYNQIRMALRDAEKTAFRTPLGNFYYTILPFRLKSRRNLSTNNDGHIPLHDAPRIGGLCG